MMDRVVDIRRFLNYDSIRQDIVYRLINTEKNTALLEDIPHMEFLDLSVVFQCMVSQEEEGYASILIYNVHLRLWDVSVEELYQEAKKNTPRIMPYELKSMPEVLCEITEAENPEEYDYDRCMEEFADSVPMYVLTNQKMIEGAACMLYPDLIREISDSAGSRLFIIPSSVHEVLILPVENTEEGEEIKSMIKEINDTKAEPGEILSYSLYYYDRAEGKIMIY